MPRSQVLITGYAKMPPNTTSGLEKFMEEFSHEVGDYALSTPWVSYDEETHKYPVSRANAITNGGYATLYCSFELYPALFHVDFSTDNKIDLERAIDKLHNYMHLDSYQATILDRTSGVELVSTHAKETMGPQNVTGETSLLTSPYFDPEYRD